MDSHQVVWNEKVATEIIRRSIHHNFIVGSYGSHTASDAAKAKI